MTYYQANAAYPAPEHADQVIGFPVPTRTTLRARRRPHDERHLPAEPDAPTRLYLKGNSCDEFWFGSQPDDFAGPNGLCGGGAFREVQVSIDGRLAGSRGVPFVFTGGVNPWLWRPVTGGERVRHAAAGDRSPPFVGR